MSYIIFFKVNICKLSFFHLIIWVRFPYVHLTAQIFILNNLFICLSSCDFYIFFIYLSNLMVITSLELTRVNPDRNILSINVELTSTFFPYKGLVHHHHWILNIYLIYVIYMWHTIHFKLNYIEYIFLLKNKYKRRHLNLPKFTKT